MIKDIRKIDLKRHSRKIAPTVYHCARVSMETARYTRFFYDAYELEYGSHTKRKENYRFAHTTFLGCIRAAVTICALSAPVHFSWKRAKSCRVHLPTGLGPATLSPPCQLLASGTTPSFEEVGTTEKKHTARPMAGDVLIMPGFAVVAASSNFAAATEPGTSATCKEPSTSLVAM